MAVGHVRVGSMMPQTANRRRTTVGYSESTQIEHVKTQGYEITGDGQQNSVTDVSEAKQ
jgi:hypothetical protein